MATSARRKHQKCAEPCSLHTLMLRKSGWCQFFDKLASLHLCLFSNFNILYFEFLFKRNFSFLIIKCIWILFGGCNSFIFIAFWSTLIWMCLVTFYGVIWLGKGFPGSSAGRESTCSARDPGSIPGLRRSPGDGIGHPLWYSWASLVTQTVKNPPAVWETWVWLLGWEGPLEEGMATHSSILAWIIPMDRGAWGVRSMGSQRIWVTKHSTWLDKLDDTNIGCHFVWRVIE